jgi:hypothetical protein
LFDIVASITSGEKFSQVNFNEAARPVTSGQNRSNLKVRLAIVLKITCSDRVHHSVAQPFGCHKK